MANWTTLKEAIANVIKTNGNQEITGRILQNTLNNIVNAVGENATFVGIATTATSPGTPNGPVFYIASTAGDYPNFGGINLAIGEIAVLHFSNGSWTKRLTNAVSKSRFLSSLALSKGYYFDASKTPKGQLTNYKLSKLTPFLYIPTSLCTFKYIWGAANVGSSFVYFDKDFKYVGETHQTSAISYDYDPSTEEIPKGAVYMIVQFQNEAFEILTSELINTGISYQNVADIQQNAADIQQNAADIQQTAADLNTKVPGTEILSKNLFDKSAIIDGFYIGTTPGNLLADSTATISPLIPVKPGTIYHIERPCLSTGCPITFEARFVEEDGKTPIKPLKESGVEYKSYNIGRNNTVKAPDNAAYFQCTLKFRGINVDYDKVQFEEGNAFTGYVPYERKFVADYPNLPSDLDGLSKRVQALEASSIEEITIANSAKIGFFSNSFLNGYCMLGKHAINNLSMLSDYIMYNYGHSGDDLLELLTRVNENQSWLGDVPVQNWGIKYGVIAMQDNDGALFAAASDTYYENGKKLANAIKAMGGIPILGTEHDSNSYYYNFTRLSKDFGLMFMDWGLTATRLFKSVFAPFWHNSHPATRTAWMWTYGMKSFLDTLPRPEKAIKIFRVRPGIDTSDPQNLMYEDIISRAERFEELTCGVSGITEATEKYFDRIDTGSAKYQTYKDEYQTLQAKSGSVSLGNFALIEVITPYDKNGISNLIVNIASTSISKIHIKKINAISNLLPSTRYVAFGVTKGAEILTSGSTFEITGGVFNNLLGTYTVEDVVNGIVVTKTSSSGKTTSGTDNPTTNVVGVTLKGSYDYPSADYMKWYNKPLGEWIEINGLDSGKVDLTSYLATCMDFDKIALLLEGNNMTISDISAVVSGTEKKITVPSSRKNLVAKKGTSLLKKQLFDSENTEWVGLGDTSVYSPVKSTVSDRYEPLPNGITTVRTMTKGQMLKQQIQTGSIQDLGFSPAVIQIRVIARYFPEYIDTDEKWKNSSIKRGSYDCAKLAIRIASSLTDTNSVKVDVIHVGAWWNEFIIETPYFPGSYLVIEAEDNNIQIARCDILQIN